MSEAPPTGLGGDAPVDTPHAPDLSDHYAKQTPTASDAELRGQGALFQKPVSSLVPDLNKVRDLPEIRDRFAADFPLVKRELQDLPELDDHGKANRTFEFFAAYAQRFVVLAKGEAAKDGETKNQDKGLKDAEKELPRKGAEEGGKAKGGSRLDRLWMQEVEPEQPKQEKKLKGETEPLRVVQQNEAPLKAAPPEVAHEEAQQFAEMLRDYGFGQMQDAHTGKDGVDAAHELLTAETLKELRQKAQQHDFVAEVPWPPRPPPEAKPEEADPKREALADLPRADEAFKKVPVKELGESPAALHHKETERAQSERDFQRAGPQAPDSSRVVVAGQRDNALRAEEGRDDTTAFEAALTNKKLGRNMLWNALHTMRGSGADSAVEKEKWDSLTFGAVLALVFLLIVVGVLVML